MPLDIPKYLPRCFTTHPADRNGVAVIDDCDVRIPDFPMVLFKATIDPDARTSRVTQVAIRTNEYISIDQRQADMQISVYQIPYPKILQMGAESFFRNKKLFDGKKLLVSAAACTATFKDMYNCVPPFDSSPPCANPQPYFDLKDQNGAATHLDGGWFILTGSIRSLGAALPPGTVITGDIALLLATNAK